MKLKSEFIINQIGDEYIVVPTDDEITDFGAMISLNETGAFLWNLLGEETTREALCENLLKEYNVDKKTAEEDVDEFINILKEKNLLETF